VKAPDASDAKFEPFNGELGNGELGNGELGNAEPGTGELGNAETRLADKAVPSAVPSATVVRLPIYLRSLRELVASGAVTVSSEELATMSGVKPATVRKDLSRFGSLGIRGSGYVAEYLLGYIATELGLGGDWPVTIVGVGNLGRALANSRGFSSRGFRVSALFDVAPEVVGSKVKGVPVSHLDDFKWVVEGDMPRIGVIATPPTEAQSVADLMVACGLRAILNFAPKVLLTPPEVNLRYMDLSIELQVMSFHLAHGAPEPDIHLLSEANSAG
jgi:redox-sensing transcriptional repressor